MSCDGPGFDSRWERCKNRASRPSKHQEKALISRSCKPIKPLIVHFKRLGKRHIHKEIDIS